MTVNGERRHVIGYMKDFLFAPEQARTPIERLSGGERGRLMLARALAAPSNLLVLDEPTNDLDIETLDLLQELIGEYKGTVLVVSHDRDFLDRVATSVIVSEGDGRWLEYAGGYSDMVAQRGYGLGGPQTAPPVEKRDKPAARPTVRAAPKRKLSFNESPRAANAARPDGGLARGFGGLEKRLADRDFAARDPAAFQAASLDYGRIRDDLQKMEDEWLALEILREEIEQGA